MNYAVTLRELWAAHVAERTANAPTVISTFAGCGGSSLGYSAAGYRELLAVEWDKHAAETFRVNFPGIPLYHGDIAKLSAEECLHLAGVKPGELDVLDGSPPCQGFSVAGKREFTDTRNQLFREYARLLTALQPRVFVMENVSGMVKGEMKLIFRHILQTLKACGYSVSVRLLNAKNYGVPQSRQRLIFIGVRSDLKVAPSHPIPSATTISVRSAWEELNQTPQDVETARIKNTWQTYRVVHQMEESKHFNIKHVRLDRPGLTLTVTIGSGGFIHPTERRLLTIPEAKRVASFPDQFRLAGPYLKQWARIGNSVPPLLMRAVALHIRTSILSCAPVAEVSCGA